MRCENVRNRDRVVAPERVEVLLCRTRTDAELESIAAGLHQREHPMREIDRVIQRHLHDRSADLAPTAVTAAAIANATNGSVIAKPRPIACTDHRLSKPSPSNVRACSARYRDDSPDAEFGMGPSRAPSFIAGCSYWSKCVATLAVIGTLARHDRQVSPRVRSPASPDVPAAARDVARRSR